LQSIKNQGIVKRNNEQSRSLIDGSDIDPSSIGTSEKDRKKKKKKIGVNRSSQLNKGDESSRKDTSSNVSGFYSRNTGGVKKKKVRSKNTKNDNLAKSN